MTKVVIPRRRALLLSGGALAAPMIASGDRPRPERLAQPAGEIHRGLSSRWSDRHAVAHRLPGTLRTHGPAVHHRESRRLRRQYRRRHHRQVAAGRLHDRPLHDRRACDRADALRQAAVRRGQGLHRRRHAVVGAQHADDAARLPGQHDPRADRAGEGQPGQILVRLVGRRHQPASHRRDVQADGRASTCCTCPTRAARPPTRTSWPARST